jgi:hypothetical protein
METQTQTFYTEDQKRRIDKYREKNREKIRDYQREYFINVRMTDPLKKERVKEVNRLASKRYREKKLLEKQSFTNDLIIVS